MIRILVLCTGNSCRSQMAEGILKDLLPDATIYSAGTKPETAVHPKAVQVMQEVGMDISSQQPKSVEMFLGNDFDFVITVCDHANETCPVFIGNVKNRLHIGFEDPAKFRGSEADVLGAFRKTRDEIRHRLLIFSRQIPHTDT